MPIIERQLTRRINLSYLQSIQITEGYRPPEDFFNVGSDFSPVAQFLNDTRPQRVIDRIGDFLGTKFPYNPDHQTRRAQDTGWVLTDQYEEVDWSKVAYRIGVRDIGLNSFEFAQVSSVVTVPIKSPKPIYKITLKAEEQIPEAFPATRAWIEYHVTTDEGKTWHRINPLGKPTRFTDEGEVVPRIITINAEIENADPEEMNLVSKEGVTSVRLRYTLYADPDNNATGISPVIKSVQLLLYPRGGLSGANDQAAL